MSRAYAEGAFTDAEYSSRLADLDARLDATRPEQLPELEVVAALAADVARLWECATPHERQLLVAPLIEQVRVDVGEKRLVEVVPAPAFRTLMVSTEGEQDA